MGLLVSPLCQVAGLGILWITGTPGYLAQAPWTKLVHPGEQLGDTLHHQSLPLASVAASHQMAGPIMEGQASRLSEHEGEIVCFVFL